MKSFCSGGFFQPFLLLQKLESLNGKKIKKVCLGEHFSVFLTHRGQVLACGVEEYTGLPKEMAALNKPIQVSSVNAFALELRVVFFCLEAGNFSSCLA